jgi:hypothetical protein
VFNQNMNNTYLWKDDSGNKRMRGNTATRALASRTMEVTFKERNLDESTI